MLNPLQRTSPSIGTLTTRPVESCEIRRVAEIERIVEGPHAASEEVLNARHSMYSAGFRVGIKNSTVVGYVETCRWNIDRFAKFEDIQNFPQHHNPQGSTLYVIYLAVEPHSRRQGIGSAIIRDLLQFAQREEISRVQLVAGPDFLPDFYAQLGFHQVRSLPNFCFDTDGILMEFRLRSSSKNLVTTRDTKIRN